MKKHIKKHQRYHKYLEEELGALLEEFNSRLDGVLERRVYDEDDLIKNTLLSHEKFHSDVNQRLNTLEAGVGFLKDEYVTTTADIVVRLNKLETHFEEQCKKLFSNDASLNREVSRIQEAVQEVDGDCCELYSQLEKVLEDDTVARVEKSFDELHTDIKKSIDEIKSQTEAILVRVKRLEGKKKCQS